MPEPSIRNRTTLRDIAQASGVHISTVARSLQNHPRIPEATRKRIQKLAKKMGYTPDPVLRALAAYRTSQRPATDHGVIAWLDCTSGPIPVQTLFAPLWPGASEQAHRSGWKLEPFRPVHDGVSWSRFRSVLRTRGINGVLIPPVEISGQILDLDLTDFSAATVGYTLGHPKLHRISAHLSLNLQRAWQELIERDYRRPGLALDPVLHERVSHQWVAAFLERQQSLPSARRLPFFLEGYDPPEPLLRWVNRYRPDCILTGNPGWVMTILKGTGIHVPGDIGVAGLGLWNHPGCAGIDERFDLIGQRAIDMIIGMINRHERGLPEAPMHLFLEGEWRDAPSVRPRPPSA